MAGGCLRIRRARVLDGLRRHLRRCRHGRHARAKRSGSGLGTGFSRGCRPRAQSHREIVCGGTARREAVLAFDRRAVPAAGAGAAHPRDRSPCDCSGAAGHAADAGGKVRGVAAVRGVCDPLPPTAWSDQQGDGWSGRSASTLRMRALVDPSSGSPHRCDDLPEFNQPGP